MSRSRNTAFAALLIVLCTSFVLSRSYSIDDLVANLERFNRELPQEKIYLHFDKPYYYSGEDIWFQAYVVAGPLHELSGLSKKIYVELIDPQGVLLKRVILKAENGVINGDFNLASRTLSGNYTIRAYSNWMRNAGPDFFFNKKIAIVDPIQDNLPVTNDQSPLEIQFFPEGGDLISDVVSNVAVKVNSEKVLGAFRKGKVFNQNEEEIAVFETNVDGIAAFSIQPQSSDQYYAKLDGTLDKYLLPQALTVGYNLSVDVMANEETVGVTIGTNKSSGDSHKMYLIVHTRGVITYAGQIEFKNQLAMHNIPTIDFVTGVNHLTLFNEQWQPEAERLFFYNGNDNLSLSISTDKAEYSIRDSTTVTIKVMDKDSNPVQGFFSMTALDSAQINTEYAEENILSNILLSSDIKGYVHNPGRFFNGNYEHLKRELDLVLMTHGWRRFDWKDIVEGEFATPEFGVEQAITLQGRLLTRKGGKPVSKGEVTHMSTYNDVPSLASAGSFEDGFFVLGGLNYYEGEENFLEAKAKKGKKELYVELDTLSFSFPKIANAQSIISENIEKAILAENLEKSIEREYIKSLYDTDDEVRDLGEFVVEGSKVGKEDQKQFEEFNLIDDPFRTKYAANALDVIKFQMPGVRVSTSAGQIMGLSVYRNSNPLILLDGIPSDLAQIRSIPARFILKVETYLSSMEATKWATDPGMPQPEVIAFFTRDQDNMLEYFRAIGDKRVNELPGGYYKSRVYHGPKYFPYLPEHEIPDNRVLIHWQPLIKTDAKGEAQVTFFNADLASTIDIKVEGISLDGALGIGERSYKVIKK